MIFRNRQVCLDVFIQYAIEKSRDAFVVSNISVGARSKVLLDGNVSLVRCGTCSVDRGGHARSPGAARWSRRSDEGGRGCGGGSASDTTSGVCGDSNGFVPGIYKPFIKFKTLQLLYICVQRCYDKEFCAGELQDETWSKYLIKQIKC